MRTGARVAALTARRVPGVPGVSGVAARGGAPSEHALRELLDLVRAGAPALRSGYGGG